MDIEKLYNGYNVDFIKESTIDLPIINEELEASAFSNKSEMVVLDYMNFSLVMSSKRKFAIYTAANIDGNLFKKAERKKSWKKDKRIKDFQLGSELYKAEKSDFDKGHMTKREDVQWGETPALAQLAANSTFYYTNAIPQHKDLNQRIWGRLEDYILHKETNEKNLKIAVFTGPVLSENDPYFVTEVRGERIQLPTLFWKVVVFPKSDGKLYRVGFIMSQKELLEKHDLVEESELETGVEDDLFNQFIHADTYQVNISLIEELTNLEFQTAIDSYTDERSKKLVLNEVEIDPDLESFSFEQFLGYSIGNLVL